MSGKTVRFAETATEYEPIPRTPSPTYSVPTVSSPTISTPSSLNSHPSYIPLSPLEPERRKLSPVDEIHPVLQLNIPSQFTFDVLLDPKETLSSYPAITSALNRHATHPPCSNLILRCDDMPWEIVIQRQSSITVSDILGAIYRNLRQYATTKELERETPRKQALIREASRDRLQRLDVVDRSDSRKKYRRVDFLVKKRRFLGLSVAESGKVLQLTLGELA